MDPEVLLAGPRGRRLCLEFAGLVAQRSDSPGSREYLHAAHLAAYDLDPGRGTSTVMLTVGAGTPEPSSSATPGEVARLLDGVRPGPYGAEDLLTALVATVDSARCWQEPDGEDVLAAAPAMRAALERVVAEMTSGGLTVGWATPVDRSGQWAVEFDHPRTATAGGTAGKQLVRWRDAEVLHEDEARAERPADVRAKVSGHWWSTPPPGLVRTTRALGDLGPVGLWLVEDSAGWERATAVPVAVPDGARVYEVDGPEAWADLCRRFPLDVSASRRHDWYRTTGVDGAWVIPDWSRVAEVYDGVHVTMAGYLTTAGWAVPVGDGWATVLAGWGPDETYWLTDVAGAGAVGAGDGVGERQVWVRRDDGRWEKASG